MKKELSKSELDLLAQSQKIDINILKSIRHLLDTKIVRDKLILFEFKEQTSHRKITKKQALESLMKKYGFSKSYIEQIVYDSRAKHKLCKSCGESIDISQWRLNKGICSKCIEKQHLNHNEED